MRLIWGTGFTFVVGIALTLAVRAGAHRFKIVSYPRQDRWHRKPTAMLGGIAIYAAFMVGVLLFERQLSPAYPIIGAASLLFAAGLVDDVIQLKPYAKLIVQLAAASILVYFGIRLNWTRSEVINDFITIFWLVGITNAINLLDNMDGLAAGISTISCLFLGATFLMNGQPAMALIVGLLAGAILAFLVFNFHPASIFMGDCGSMFLGFILGGTSLLSIKGQSRNLTAILFTPALILAIPILDTCVVAVTRKLSGRPISQGGRDHTSHRLVALGMSESKAVLMLYSLALVSGVLAMLVRLLNVQIGLLLVPGFALAAIFLGLYLGKVHVGERASAQNSAIIGVLEDFSYKRRIFEVLLDLALVTLAYYGAYLLRWDGSLPREQLQIFMRTLPLLIVVQMASLLAGGVYRGLWRYVGAEDLMVIARSVASGCIVSSVIVLFIYWFKGPSRAVFLLDALLLLVSMGASRLSFKLLKMLFESPNAARPDARPVFIYGADDGGDMLCRFITASPDYQFAPVGFIDDDSRKAGKLIRGYKIFDSRQLPELLRAHGVKDVLCSNSSIPKPKLDFLRSMGACPRLLSIRIE